MSNTIVEKWLTFKKIERKPKTDVWDVTANCDGSKLGVIRWYPYWRHYCFIVNLELIKNLVEERLELVYSDRCLQSIKDFVTKLNEEYKQKREIKNV